VRISTKGLAEENLMPVLIQMLMHQIEQCLTGKPARVRVPVQ
jgi:hypothetical protein